MARFGNANEHGDWETAHHVFTYANALHQMLKRIGTTRTDGHVTGVRGILHGAMALYLTRYLNVPPARIPGEGDEQLGDLPADVETIRAGLLDAFDRQRQVDLAATRCLGKSRRDFATVLSNFFAAGKTAATSPKNDGQAYFAGNQR